MRGISSLLCLLCTGVHTVDEIEEEAKRYREGLAEKVALEKKKAAAKPAPPSKSRSAPSPTTTKKPSTTKPSSTTKRTPAREEPRVLPARATKARRMKTKMKTRV